MLMKNPPHPGEMIGDEIEEIGVSISAAAKAIGVTRQQLHNLISGRSRNHSRNGRAPRTGDRQQCRYVASLADELRPRPNPQPRQTAQSHQAGEAANSLT